MKRHNATIPYTPLCLHPWVCRSLHPTASPTEHRCVCKRRRSAEVERSCRTTHTIIQILGEPPYSHPHPHPAKMRPKRRNKRLLLSSFGWATWQGLRADLGVLLHYSGGSVPIVLEQGLGQLAEEMSHRLCLASISGATLAAGGSWPCGLTYKIYIRHIMQYIYIYTHCQCMACIKYRY